jgi:hypothetical protein
LAKGLETFIDLIDPSRFYSPPNENLAATKRMLLLSNTNGKKMVKQRSGFGYSFWHLYLAEGALPFRSEIQ